MGGLWTGRYGVRLERGDHSKHTDRDSFFFRLCGVVHSKTTLIYHSIFNSALISAAWLEDHEIYEN